MKLSQKQKLFCENYVLNGYNATDAYVEAGYAVKKRVTAGKNSFKLLNNAEIQSYIRTLESERDGKFQITKDDILKELGKMAFGNLNDVVDFEHGKIVIKQDVDPAKKRNFLASVSNVSSSVSYSKDGQAKSFSITAKDKLKSLELIARMTGVLDGETDNGDAKPAISRVLDAIRNIKK